MEAKEKVKPTAEMRVSSSISYQALFGYYRKLAGMTVGEDWVAGCRPRAPDSASVSFPALLVPATLQRIAAWPTCHPFCMCPCHAKNCSTARASLIAAMFVPPVPQGTASTEALELGETYGLDVVRVPPHRPSRRVDHPMRVFYMAEVGLPGRGTLQDGN